MSIGVMETEVPQIVLLRNVGTKVYTVRHNKRSWDIVPGGELHLPWEAASSFLGDPRAIDVGKNKFRRILYDQVRAMNNFYLGMDTETREQAIEKTTRTGQLTSSWEEKKPPIQVFTIDGQRIYMLADDPDGTMENPWGRIRTPVDSSNTALLEDQIARMQQQIAQLIQVVESRQPLPSQLAEPTPTPSPIITPDSPSFTVSADPGPVFNPAPQVVGHIPDMNDGIRTDLMPLGHARIPSPEELFQDDDSAASASAIPSPPPDTAVITPDSPKSTKPVSRPRPKS